MARPWPRAAVWSFTASRAIVRPGVLVALIVTLAPLCLLLTQSRLHASGNTITVNTTDDPGRTTEGSLRAAINNANNKTSDSNSTCAAGTGTDTINFSVSGTITLTSTLPTIANTSPGTLTIDGTGQSITIDGAHSYQVMTVNAGATLALNELTIADGLYVSGAFGGGISNGGTLTITSSVVSGNSSPGGGGIFNNGD